MTLALGDLTDIHDEIMDALEYHKGRQWRDAVALLTAALNDGKVRANCKGTAIAAAQWADRLMVSLGIVPDDMIRICYRPGHVACAVKSGDNWYLTADTMNPAGPTPVQDSGWKIERWFPWGDWRQSYWWN